MNRKEVHDQLKRISKRKHKTPPVDDSEDGDYPSDLPSLKAERQIRTKVGDDGVEETHVTYLEMKDKIRMKPLGDKWDQIDWSK